MPLHDRRPQLLSLSISTCSGEKTPEGVHTPLPGTPFAWNQAQAPLIMTPDTPYFEMSSGVFGGNQENEKVRDNIELEWTESEDEMLSSYLSRPASTRSYPPGTLPPSDVLDNMTTQILSRLSRSSSSSSLSSDTSSDSDVDMDAAPLPRKRTSGWGHSWSATRARLFRIARLESREALGGHTRNKSESFVPIPNEKSDGPSLIVLGNGGLVRQQQTMESMFSAGEQTIEGAVKLSSALQNQAKSGSSILHSNQSLSSPVAFEFGPSVFSFPSTSTTPTSSTIPLPLPRAPVNRRLPAAFPVGRSLPRPSLLQRGRSYTGADLARERGHNRDASMDSTDSMDGEETDTGSPMSSANSLLALPPYGRPMVRRSATSPTAFVFPAPGSRRGSVEADPITPLNQTTFPQSAIGLGNRVLTGDSDGDSTPGSTPCITLTRTSPVSTPSSDSSTPRLGASFDFPAVEFANLSIAAPAPTVTALGQSSGHIRRPTRPPPLARSMSESTSLAGLAFPHPAQLSTSISHPSGLNTFLGPTPSVTPVSRPSLAMTSMEGSPENPREAKRQRTMPLPNRPRLNPGLTVVVPNTGLGVLASDGLRSPFEQKSPGGSLMI